MRLKISVLLFISLLIAGCGAKEGSSPESATTNAAVEAQATVDPADATTSAAIEEARASIKSGEIDQAAARLAQLQSSGTSFNAQQAKDYRQTLSEAYDRAIEAAQRGDARAQAALQLLRAAGPR